MTSRSVAVALVAMLASGTAVTLADRSPARLPSDLPVVQRVSPTQSTLSCPPAIASRDTVTSVFAVSPPGKQSTAAGGAVELAPLRRVRTEATDKVTQRGEPLRRNVEPSRGAAWSVAASGSLAPGATAAAFSVLSGRRVAGLAATGCGPPGNDWWFNGVDTSVGATSRLVLTNPTPALAIVDLAFFGPRGPIEPAGANGIAVAPRSSQSFDLARFVPGENGLTVNVRASSGSVVAAVSTTKLRGLSSLGAEWLPPSAPPSTDLVIDPAPRTTGQSRLVLTNTSTREALAHVRVFDASGTFTPTSLGDLRLKPGAAASKDLTAVTDGGAVGVRVTANVTLTGAITTDEAGSADFTVSTATAPMTGPAVVPLLRVARLSLLLTSASSAGARVRVLSYDAEGQRVASEQVAVRGAATTTWSPSTRGSPSYLVLNTRAGADVQGIASYRGAAGITSLPVLSGLWSVQRPAVSPAP